MAGVCALSRCAADPALLSATRPADLLPRRRLVLGGEACPWSLVEKISALRRFENEGKLRRVPILTGNGSLFLDFEMERGVDGAMTGYALPGDAD